MGMVYFQLGQREGGCIFPIVTGQRGDIGLHHNGQKREFGL
jgi:hypothetical protein